MGLRIVVEPDEDGVFVARVPALPGCIAQGGTEDEAATNAREAIQLYLESLQTHGAPDSLKTSEG